jgi:hypothetical protein
MNDPNALLLATAAVLGAIVATVARLLPEVIDITFIPACAAVVSGAGIFLAIVTGHSAAVWAKIWGAAGAILGVVIYVLALLGWA